MDRIFNMREKTLRHLAVICAVLGLGLLFYVSEVMETQAVKIASVGIDDVGIGVKVCGVVMDKRVSKNHIFMDLRDESGDIRLVIFNTTALALKGAGIDLYAVPIGKDLCSTGVVSEYPKGSGELELIYRRGSIGLV